MAPAIAAPSTAVRMNYRYTFTGPNDVAPLKIFDDGTSTFFKLPPSASLPRLAVITARGEEIEVPYQFNADGLAVVNVVAPRFSLRNKGSEVIIYNETTISG
jgi:type IV secretion system protein VirB9